MTFWPFIISWIYPSVFPIAFCWRTKYLDEFPPTVLDTNSITATPSSTSSISHTLKYAMIIRTVRTITLDCRTTGSVSETTCRMASISFV